MANLYILTRYEEVEVRKKLEEKERQEEKKRREEITERDGERGSPKASSINKKDGKKVVNLLSCYLHFQTYSHEADTSFQSEIQQYSNIYHTFVCLLGKIR